MRGLLWFAVGAGATVFAVVKVRGVARQATPQAIGQRVAGSAAGVGDRALEFTRQVRAGMAEREAELRRELNLPGAGTTALGPAD